MDKTDYALTFACYGQLDYTRQCIESMVRHGTPLDRLVVVDNGSKDATREYLATLPLGGRIYNQDNLGCGVAWNQGALALQAEWTIIMNNDVLVSAHWIEDLIGAAKKAGLRVISPSLVEGLCDYDFDTFAAQAGAKMHEAMRVGWCHAVCLAVHRSVWMDIGYFQPVPKLLGYEDTLFFHEMDKGGIQGGTTGASWLHHFGSITQTAMKQERGLRQKAGLGYRYNYKLLRKSWLRRKLDKAARNRQLQTWREEELARYGMTMRGYTQGGKIIWD
ncbi:MULTISPECIES: glycosyltransferase [Ramlibacter]|uniref:Glycosyltransferase n=1 Tax=Ramlibacter aquaticus TaxID=2780094 RepID=A0ABR9SAD2_9BURK|nr:MULTISPECIES: glycosyltransferase [Ramlibacter]MBE7939306.1 glycosyltransferase [Ramlibacter aquaticus]